MKSIFRGRALALVALLLLVATVLTGCGGCGGGEKATVTVADVRPESLQVAKDTNSGIDPALTDTELNTIAKLLATTYSANLNTREILIAAYRGHNLINPNPALDINQIYEPDLDAVRTLIQKANEAAGDGVAKASFDYGKLNNTDLLVLVNAFKTYVNVNAESGGFDGILTAIGKLLNWLTYLGFGSYIVGTCIFAIIIEAFMLPFAIKQQKNSIKQAKLRPKEMAIRNRYKGRTDQVSMQKMQQEIQEFYQRENFSPYSGCLPLVIQLPIIMALYYIVIDPLHYVLGQASTLSTALSTFYTASPAAGGMGGVLSQSAGRGTIEILSALRENGIEAFSKLNDFLFFSNGGEIYGQLANIGDIPNFNIGPVNFGTMPSFDTFNVLLLVPVLTFAVYFISSKVTRKLMNSQPAANNDIEKRQMACSNVMMDVMMPAMSTYFTFMVPAIIGVYWIFRCLLNMLKQFIMSRVMPLPVFTEEDYKAAAKEMAGKRPPKKEKSANVGKVRSLHHIDDEDFEDTRERALARKAAIEEREREEQAQQAKDTPIAAASLKKDDKPAKKAKKKADENPETVVKEEVAQETVETVDAAQAPDQNPENNTNHDGE